MVLNRENETVFGDFRGLFETDPHTDKEQIDGIWLTNWI